MKRVVAVAVLVATPALAAAHDLWVERSADGFVVRYGHRGGDLLDLDAGRVKRIVCLDVSGARTDALPSARFAPREVRFAGPCAVVSVLHDGGAWSLTPDGEVNLPRTRARNVVKAWASRQYAKWVDARGSGAGAVLGDELELVPASSLARTREGDKITLRVLSAGQPVSHAVVAIDHRPIGETDSRGEVRLRVRARDVESVTASIRRPRASPEVDADVLEASLSFEVAR